MVAHAATFVATLGAAFLFMSSFQWRKTWQGRWKSYLGQIVCFVISGGLLFLATYVLFRMLWYGQLAVAVETSTACEETTLAAYYGCVTKHVLEAMRKRGLPYSFIAHFQGSYNDPFGLFCALVVGYVIALLVSFLLDGRRS
jgi:hypothetical protein